MRANPWTLVVLALTAVAVTAAGEAVAQTARTVQARTCAKADVEAAIAQANAGDVVLVPAGSCTWSGPLALTKAITLQGAGKDSTTIRTTGECNYSGGPGCAIRVTAAMGPTPGLRITGFAFQGERSSMGIYWGRVNVHGYRIDHNRFQLCSPRAIELGGYSDGVIDHNELIDNGKTDIVVFSDDDAAWARSRTLGDADGVTFVENNSFTYTGAGVDAQHAITANDGGRYTFRYNTIDAIYDSNHHYAAPIDVHGRCDNDRGASTFEIYNNTIRSEHSFRGMFLRGGNGVVFNNAFQRPASGCEAGDCFTHPIVLVDYRYCHWSCKASLGTCVPGEDGDGHCMDQLRQLHLWNNTYDGTAVTPYVEPCSSAIIVENEEYFLTARPGYVPYAYPHPLVAAAEPPGTAFAPNQCVEAEQGTMVAPVTSVADSTASGGAYVATQTSDKGEVSFAFDVADAGRYLLQASVRTPAPETSHNSFFIGLDDEAASGVSADVFDTATTTAFAWDNVSRRGTGTTGPEFDPAVFNLTAGRHRVRLYGRESNTQLDRVILRRCPNDDCAAVTEMGCGCAPAETKACYSGTDGTAGVGICRAGTSTCGDDGLWGPCLGEVLPVAELCNGADDDCDGPSDETFASLSTACAAGNGACAAAGTYVCTADGLGVECDATPSAPNDEVCGNDLDEDCEGTLDNGCGCASGATRPCYAGPAGTAGVGACKQGTQTCADGEWSTCAGAVLPQVESCADGIDSDCDGRVDAADTADCGCANGDTDLCYDGPAATATVGICRPGTRTCNGGTWGACQGEILPGEEICADGLDNDCDGTSDTADTQGCSLEASIDPTGRIVVDTVNVSCAAAEVPLGGGIILVLAARLLLAARRRRARR